MPPGLPIAITASICRGHFDPKPTTQIARGETGSLVLAVARRERRLDLGRQLVGLAMALQALHPDAVNDLIIPLGINSDAGEQLTISISESHLPTGTEVYLEDTVQQTYTPLHEMDFILTPGSSLNGTGRFFLRFGNGTLSNDDFDTEALNIYHKAASGTVVIAGQLKHNSMAYLYDLQGRVVRTTALKVAALEQQVDVNGLSTGVYVLSFEQNGTVVSEKLILR